MTAPVAAAPRLAARPVPPSRAGTAPSDDALALRLAPFVLLCGLGALEWAGFLARPQDARALGVAAIAGMPSITVSRTHASSPT